MRWDGNLLEVQMREGIFYELREKKTKSTRCVGKAIIARQHLFRCEAVFLRGMPYLVPND